MDPNPFGVDNLRKKLTKTKLFQITPIWNGKYNTKVFGTDPYDNVSTVNYIVALRGCYDYRPTH